MDVRGCRDAGLNTGCSTLAAFLYDTYHAAKVANAFSGVRSGFRANSKIETVRDHRSVNSWVREFSVSENSTLIRRNALGLSKTRRITCVPLSAARQPGASRVAKADSIGNFGSSDVISTMATFSRSSHSSWAFWRGLMV